jgi:hypothetical protein
MKRIGLIDNLRTTLDGTQSAMALTAADVMTMTGGNTGNLAYVGGVRGLLANPLARLQWGEETASVRERFDHVVVCCANQIGAHVDLGGWADNLSRWQLPVTLIGLGAQSEDFSIMPKVPVGTKRFLGTVKALAPSAQPNTATRGDFTARVLADQEHEATAICCPSLFLSPDLNLGGRVLTRQRKQAFERVAVAAGNPWHGPSARLEPALVDVVEQYNGRYILQHPIGMLQIAMGEHDNVSPAMMSRFIEVYGRRFDVESLFTWYQQHAEYFLDLTAWADSLALYDGVIGPRFHGIALGVQVGIPGCVIAIDSRTEEMCISSGIKYVKSKALVDPTASDLVDAIRWSADDASRFDSNRRAKALQFLDFLAQNDLSPSPALTAIAHG